MSYREREGSATEVMRERERERERGGERRGANVGRVYGGVKIRRGSISVIT